MKRLTRAKDLYECRMADGCPAEEWISEVSGEWIMNFRESTCSNCPFMRYINRLAEYEDLMVTMDDDKK